MSLIPRLTSVTLLAATVGLCQTSAPPLTQPTDGQIHLDVVVSSKSGKPDAELQQRDFTVFDNKAQQPITSFRVMGGPGAPVKVLHPDNLGLSGDVTGMFVAAAAPF